MKTVGLLTNERNPAALESARRLVAEMSGRSDVRVLARASVADAIAGTSSAEAASVDASAASTTSTTGDLCCAAAESEIAQADFVVVFGGDGTILAAARFVAPYGTPMLTIHLGHFGFITEAPPDQVLQAVETVLAGRARVEERLLLRGTIERGASRLHEDNRDTNADNDELLAMNDIVIASGSVRMTHIRTEVDGVLLATYAADGVIVASPTGSTGYSLSAGGPLLHPEAPVLVVTPICPHTLNARALVIPASHSVRLTVEGRPRETVIASADGQIDVPLETGDSIIVGRSPYTVKLLSVGGPSFYEKIRTRWHFGERASS